MADRAAPPHVGATDGAAPQATTPVLELRGVRLRRGGREVLDGVDLSVGRAEVLGLLGPNGAGKTTIFKVLCGMLPPDGGELRSDGRAIRPGDRAFLARCGVVFQEPALDPRLSARQNLRLAARLYGRRARATRARIDALLQRAALADRADEPVARLSGGMRRRVELARALVHEPDLLILDEPTTGLDEAAFRRFWADLLALRERRGTTLLLTTHRADEAEHCDRIGILDRGRVVACDTADRLRARVRGDLVVVEANEPERVRAILAERFGLAARNVDGRLAFERERAHEWIPRIVEALPAGALRSIGLRRTGLGEVFLQLTGHELAGGAEPSAVREEERA